VFDRKQDAVAWEQDQSRKLRAGDWLDPRRGRVTLASVEPVWTESRKRLKRKTQEADASAWAQHIEHEFGRVVMPRSPRLRSLRGWWSRRGRALDFDGESLPVDPAVAIGVRCCRRADPSERGGSRDVAIWWARREGEFWTPEELDASSTWIRSRAGGLGRCPCRRLSSPSSTVGRLGRTGTTGFAAPPRAPLRESN